MRVFLLSLVTALLSLSPAHAFDMKGEWLDNKEWDGVQAVVVMYDCEDGNGMCARISRAYSGNLAAGQKNYLLLRNIVARGNRFEGIINPPVSFVGDSKVTIKVDDDNNISYSSCFLPVCKGTMTRLR